MNKLNAVLCSIVSGICFFFAFLLIWAGWVVSSGMTVPLWLCGALALHTSVYTMGEARMEWNRGD